MVVKNKGNTATFVTSRAETIIDLTLVSDTIHNAVTDWHVNKSYQFSDHRRLEFDLNYTCENIILTRNFRSADWQHFKAILDGLDRKSGWYTPIAWSKQILDEEVTHFLQRVNIALDKVCPLRKIDFGTKNVKTWWNKNQQVFKH